MDANFSLSHLKEREAESIYIMREVAGQFECPVLLYSVGKDSSVLLHLAAKAFAPGPIPFPLLHIDTGYKFEEMYSFRDSAAKHYGATLKVHRNEEAIAQGTNPYEKGTQYCCGLLKTKALLDSLKEGGFDAAIGGARREEEKSRAKERVFSFRDAFGQWDPKNQRPELWQLYNGKIHAGESIRVFPISQWTELDVWHYIKLEQIEVSKLYFAKKRRVYRKGDLLIQPINQEQESRCEEVSCRFRTLGCIPCTGAVESSAATIDDIIEEMLSIRVSERATRVIDHEGESSMERKKKEGYF